MSTHMDTTLDIGALRQDTPACEQLNHLNNAGASLMPKPVLQALINHLELETTIGGYEAADYAQDKLNHVYEAGAKLLNCHLSELAFVENATRAWDMAFYGFTFNKGDRILTSMSEYASNYIAYLQVAQKTGASIEAIPNDENGQLCVDSLKSLIDDRVKLISITHIPTNGGLVNPAEAVGQIANNAGIPYLLDACQSVGQLPVDVQKIGCDILSFTGRKFVRGPRGTGMLYVRDTLIEKLEPPFLDLHAATWSDRNSFKIRQDAKRFENWECNFAGKIGLGVAIDYALALGLEAIEARNIELSSMLRERASDINGVTVRDLGSRQCAIVSLSIDNANISQVQRQLQENQINTSVSGVAYTRLDMENRNLKQLLRVSPHYYNTAEELTQFCHTLAQLVHK